MLRKLICGLGAVILLATAAPVAMAASKIRIATPTGNDAYSHLVARAEADDMTVDFSALRHAWLDSAARKHRASIEMLTRDLNSAVSSGKDTQVRDTAERILAIDYTDLMAHLRLRQACAALHDDECANHFHFTEFGLLNSITTGHDGKSFATAWPVISLDEEYFMMGVAGMSLQTQSLVTDGGRSYDRMAVKMQDGSTATYYFDISAFFGIHEFD